MDHAFQYLYYFRFLAMVMNYKEIEILLIYF